MRTIICVLWRLSLALALSGCGGQDTQTASGTGPGGGGSGTGGGSAYPCPPGELFVDERCEPAGLPGDWTKPGPAVAPTPGVPPGGCGEGFVHDGLGGCEAILPAAPCTGAQMAVPGDATCRPIADCATGTWGNIPVDASTIYVDQSFNGSSDGSSAAPFPTVQAAVDAAPSGATIAVAAGSYIEDVRVEGKSVAIWGRCPELVEIVGTGAGGAVVIADAPGAELHAVAVTGPRAGVLVLDSPATVLSRLHVHDLPEPGVGAAGAPPEVTLTDSLVVDAGIYGVISQGALAVTDSEIRGTTASTDMRGLACYLDPGSPETPTLTVVGSNVHHADIIAIVALSADVTVTRSVIADTAPQPADERSWAILASDQDGPPTTMTIRQTVMSRNTDSNVRIYGSQVIVDEVTIEDCLPNGSGYGVALSVQSGVANPAIAGEAIVTRTTLRDMTLLAVDAYHGSITADEVLVQRVAASPQGDGRGRGFFLGWSNEGTGPSELVLARSIVEHVVKEAIVVSGSDAVIRDSIIRDVTDANDDELAAGVSVGTGRASPTTRSNVLLERTLVTSVAGVGVFSMGSDVVLRDSVVSEIGGLPIEGISGVGVVAAGSEQTSTSTVLVSGCLVEDNASRGIVAESSELTVEATLVRRTRSENPSQPGDGRGIEVQGGMATIRSCEIADVASAGLFVASAAAGIHGVHLHDVDLNATGSEGFGLVVSSLLGTNSSTTAEGCLIERVGSVGALADGSSFELAGTLVTDVATNAEGRFGRGIGSQRQDGWLRVTNCRVERVVEDGIFLFDGAGEIVDSSVNDVRAAADDGLYGDGIVLIEATSALVRGCEIGGVARAALSSFGSQATLADNDLRCNDLPLASESTSGVPSLLQDAGGNLCGCAEPVQCKAVSAGLTPPDAVPPTEEAATP